MVKTIKVVNCELNLPAKRDNSCKTALAFPFGSRASSFSLSRSSWCNDSTPKRCMVPSDEVVILPDANDDESLSSARVQASAQSATTCGVYLN